VGAPGASEYFARAVGRSLRPQRFDDYTYLGSGLFGEPGDEGFTGHRNLDSATYLAE
jgi:hypothetical protein